MTTDHYQVHIWSNGYGWAWLNNTTYDDFDRALTDLYRQTVKARLYNQHGNAVVEVNNDEQPNYSILYTQ